MRYIYLAIFAIFFTLHLYASLKNDKHFRNATKGYLLMSILGFYLSSDIDHCWFIIIALLLSFAGDMLLIPHGLKWFTIGGIVFLLSHFFFVLGYSELFSFSNVPLFAIILISIFFVFVVIIIFSKLRKYLPKALFIPMLGYLLVNGAMNSFAIFRLIACPSLGSTITCIGAFLFFISDTFLFFVRFNKDCKLKSHFFVMLTYSIGELLIVLGLV